jgi:altronate hydrolase
MRVRDEVSNPVASAPVQAIRLHDDDDVVIARSRLVGGTLLTAEGVRVSGLIPARHKVAVRGIKPGQAIRRTGQIIGFASCAIQL